MCTHNGFNTDKFKGIKNEMRQGTKKHNLQVDRLREHLTEIHSVRTLAGIAQTDNEQCMNYVACVGDLTHSRRKMNDRSPTSALAKEATTTSQRNLSDNFPAMQI